MTADGQPIREQISVELRGEHTDENPTLDKTGWFHDVHVADEPLTLAVYRAPGGSVRLGPKSPDLLGRVTLLEGQAEARLGGNAWPTLPAEPAVLPRGPGPGGPWLPNYGPRPTPSGGLPAE